MITTVPGAGRKTGIRLLGDMDWGSHMCVFYETQKDLWTYPVSVDRLGKQIARIPVQKWNSASKS